MSPKDKRRLARDHLELAREEADDDRLGPATTMLLHAVEAAIDALAADHGIPSSPHHWRRGEIARELHANGLLPADESGLIVLLNEEPKASPTTVTNLTSPARTSTRSTQRVAAIVEAAEGWS